MWEARQVGALAILVLSVAAIDSLNPSTIAPAAVLALGEQPARRVGLFTLGVFAASTAGGLVLLFAVGQSVVAKFAHPSPHTRHLLELAIGIALLLVAGLLWALRDRLRAHLGREPAVGDRSALLLGAGIMAIELPTAFPYFAAILATLGAVHGAVRQTVFIVLYNLVFVAPLLALTLLVALTGSRYRDRITRISTLIKTHGPGLLPPAIAIVGAALVVIGVHDL
jgi:cytochrome c biogenesis protein CcdA